MTQEWRQKAVPKFCSSAFGRFTTVRNRRLRNPLRLWSRTGIFRQGFLVVTQKQSSPTASHCHHHVWLLLWRSFLKCCVSFTSLKTGLKPSRKLNFCLVWSPRFCLVVEYWTKFFMCCSVFFVTSWMSCCCALEEILVGWLLWGRFTLALAVVRWNHFVRRLLLFFSFSRSGSNEACVWAVEKNLVNHSAFISQHCTGGL